MVSAILLADSTSLSEPNQRKAMETTSNIMSNAISYDRPSLCHIPHAIRVLPQFLLAVF